MTNDFCALIGTAPLPAPAARLTGAQKWLRDPFSLKASVEQVASCGGGLEQRRRLVRRGGVAGDAAQVHQVDHRGRRAPLRHGVDHRGDGPQALAEAAVRLRHGQSEQPVRAERGDRVFRERRVAIDARRLRREVPLGDRGSSGDDPLLLVVQSIHCLSSFLT